MTLFRVYFRHLLRVIPARSVRFLFLLAFSRTKTFTLHAVYEDFIVKLPFQFAKTCPYLFIPHVCHVSLKHVLLRCYLCNRFNWKHFVPVKTRKFIFSLISYLFLFHIEYYVRAGNSYESVPTSIKIVQSQQWKHQEYEWNLFKVNNKDTRVTYSRYILSFCKNLRSRVMSASFLKHTPF